MKRPAGVPNHSSQFRELRSVRTGTTLSAVRIVLTVRIQPQRLRPFHVITGYRCPRRRTSKSSAAPAAKPVAAAEAPCSAGSSFRQPPKVVSIQDMTTVFPICSGGSYFVDQV
jgi:hypothetical protein